MTNSEQERYIISREKAMLALQVLQLESAREAELIATANERLVAFLAKEVE